MEVLGCQFVVKEDNHEKFQQVIHLLATNMLQENLRRLTGEGSRSYWKIGGKITCIQVPWKTIVFMWRLNKRHFILLCSTLAGYLVVNVSSRVCWGRGTSIDV